MGGRMEKKFFSGWFIQYLHRPTSGFIGKGKAALWDFFVFCIGGGWCLIILWEKCAISSRIVSVNKQQISFTERVNLFVHKKWLIGKYLLLYLVVAYLSFLQVIIPETFHLTSKTRGIDHFPDY